MKGMKTAILVIMVLVFSATAYPKEGAGGSQGKAAAAREDNLLAFGTGELIKNGPAQRWARLLSNTVAIA